MVCECGEDSFECLDNNHFLHHISPKLLVDAADAEIAKSTTTSSKYTYTASTMLSSTYMATSQLLPLLEKLPEFLKRSLTEKQSRCPRESEDKTFKCRYRRSQKFLQLISAPRVLSLNLNWECNYALSDVLKVFALIPNTFRTKDLYESENKGPGETYILKGMILYWNYHYMGAFRDFDTYRGGWTLYDDSYLRDFESWEDMLKDCIRSRMKPTVLFYERVIDKVAYCSLKSL